MRHYIFFIYLFVALFNKAGAQSLQWQQVAPGVWKGIAGQPETYDLLKASGSVPATEALQKMGNSPCP
ncbi:hypothetical protein KRR40_46790 [Niabella defluvii]|nr:hypothetical protein KRR40_46790 [Niabella sp. I65]